MPPKLPNTPFRVLIAGRANAGKTAILSSVCGVRLDVSQERGEHGIYNERHFGRYVFHDSRGVETGGQDEVDILVQFIQNKGRQRRLINRLHAIWYCIPLVDNPRSYQDIDFYKLLRERVASAKVPMILVFTKYDEFKNQMKVKLAREGCKKVWEVSSEEVESRSWAALSEQVSECECEDRYVALEKMDNFGDTTELLTQTAKALDDKTLMFMLYSVQDDNMNLSIKLAIEERTRQKAERQELKAEDWIKYFPIPLVRG